MTFKNLDIPDRLPVFVTSHFSLLTSHFSHSDQ